MHFSKFNEAISDLDKVAREFSGNEISGLASIFLGTLQDSQFFYIPSAAYLIEGKVFDPRLKMMMNLPFDNTAVLSETHVRMSGEETWKISLAVNPDGNTKASKLFNALLTHRGIHKESIGWCVLSLIKTQQAANIDLGIKGWVPSPGAWAYVSYPKDGDGYNIQTFPLHDTGLTNEETAFELNEDIGAIQNLCTMLGLNNVKQREVNPSEALNRKRKKRGNLPLYSYHILEVDGERWEGEHLGANTGRGVRSHFRRGHIRRLSKDRAVFVRATMVKGSVRGFVDKDYNVNPRIPDDYEPADNGGAHA